MVANSAQNNSALPAYLPEKPRYVFVLLWAILFILYLPASRAGWVSDPVEALYKMRHWPFWQYVNLKESRGNMYQLTQLMPYVFYKLFGIHRWPWHLLFISLQALDATLILVFFKTLFDRSGVKYGSVIALGGVILFCVCPHISEVVVWKASYHYMQAMLLIVCILLLLQKFQAAPKAKYALASAFLFLLSTFSDEFYFLTPLFAFTLLCHYRLGLGYDKSLFKKGLLYFLLPMIIVIVLHSLIPLLSSGAYASTIGDEAHQPLSDYLRKPPLYIFHILFFGRFFTHDTRQLLYDFAASTKGLIIIYSLLVLLCLLFLFRYRHMSPAAKVGVLLFSWMLFAMAIVSPVWFPDLQLVNFDRYTYFMLPPIFMLVMLLFTHIRVKEWGITFFIIFSSINILLTWQVTKYWKHSTHVVDQLVHNLPPVDNKTVLLLNVPINMNGVPMFGPFLHFSFKEMYNLFNDHQLNNKMFDVVSCNMTTPNDGAHVNVYNDSMLHVTMNQWGTWWWNNMRGASSYENEYYKLNMIDMGHWYELTLKKPASEYILLYNVADQWKIVDWNKRNDDQN